MRQLVLTGLSNEINLADPSKPLFVLLFNNGELRVSVEGEEANKVLAYVLEDAKKAPAPRKVKPRPKPVPVPEPEMEEIDEDDDNEGMFNFGEEPREDVDIEEFSSGEQYADQL